MTYLEFESLWWNRSHGKLAAVKLLMLLLPLVGCNNNPPVAPVSGKVSLKNSTFVDGRVLFLPVNGGQQALGVIQEDGTFRLGTFSDDDGALVGEHHALIVKASLAADPDNKLHFRRDESKRITVRPDTENKFEFEMDSDEWSESQ